MTVVPKAMQTPEGRKLQIPAEADYGVTEVFVEEGSRFGTIGAPRLTSLPPCGERRREARAGDVAGDPTLPLPARGMGNRSSGSNRRRLDVDELDLGVALGGPGQVEGRGGKKHLRAVEVGGDGRSVLLDEARQGRRVVGR